MRLMLLSSIQMMMMLWAGATGCAVAATRRS